MLAVPVLKKVSYPIKSPTEIISRASKVFNSEPLSFCPTF